jgi:outer membrane protein assembly factor BamA
MFLKTKVQLLLLSTTLMSFLGAGTLAAMPIKSIKIEGNNRVETPTILT